MKKIEKLCNDLDLKDTKIVKLKGDYSERNIYRIIHSNGSFIGVTGNNIKENIAFLEFSKVFQKQNINVPEIMSVSDDKSSYILEDLGDETVKKYCDDLFSKGDIQTIKSIYSEIVRSLPKIQIKLYDKIDYSFCYQREKFDRKNLISDISRFEEYFLEKFYSKYNAESFQLFKENLIGIVLQQPSEYFFYRDFQTRNFMIKAGKIYFIDFQSGRKGPLQYDLASFIYSSGTISYDGMEEDLTDLYLEELKKYTPVDEVDFKNSLPAFGAVRLMQAMGNYAYYFYTREDKSIYSKIDTNLNMIKLLAERLGVDCGIY